MGENAQPFSPGPIGADWFQEGSMKVCLVSPPTVTDFEDPAVAETEAIRLISEHAPIGILSLAAVLGEKGFSASIIDLNRWYYEFLRSADSRVSDIDFCRYVADRLQHESFDVLGLSTICSSYPLTLRIATEVRKAMADPPIVLGGPQASVVDVATLKNFAAVDYIVRGEAEETLPRLLASLSRPATLDLIFGITFRRADRVIRN